MRTLFLILLILLLPIRGWSTERMAVHMVTGVLHSTMPDDCPMKMQATDVGMDAGDHSKKIDRSCQACQLCMSCANQETPELKAPKLGAPSYLVPRADRFASVDLARLAKPPIY